MCVVPVDLGCLIVWLRVCFLVASGNRNAAEGRAGQERAGTPFWCCATGLFWLLCWGRPRHPAEGVGETEGRSLGQREGQGERESERERARERQPGFPSVTACVCVCRVMWQQHVRSRLCIRSLVFRGGAVQVAIDIASDEEDAELAAVELQVVLRLACCVPHGIARVETWSGGGAG